MLTYVLHSAHFPPKVVVVSTLNIYYLKAKTVQMITNVICSGYDEIRKSFFGLQTEECMAHIPVVIPALRKRCLPLKVFDSYREVVLF